LTALRWQQLFKVTTMESEEETLEPQEELYHIQESTNDDGSVDVEILGWKKEEVLNEDRVFVRYRKPTMEVDQESMKWPQKDSDEYKFVRLIRHLGFDLHGANQIEGSVMKFKGGSLVVPENKSLLDLLSEKYTNIKETFRINASPIIIFLYSFVMLILAIFYPILLKTSPKVLDIIPSWVDFGMFTTSMIAASLSIFGLLHAFEEYKF